MTPAYIKCPEISISFVNTAEIGSSLKTRSLRAGMLGVASLLSIEYVVQTFSCGCRSDSTSDTKLQVHLDEIVIVIILQTLLFRESGDFYLT